MQLSRKFTKEPSMTSRGLEEGIVCDLRLDLIFKCVIEGTAQGTCSAQVGQVPELAKASLVEKVD